MLSELLISVALPGSEMLPGTKKMPVQWSLAPEGFLFTEEIRRQVGSGIDICGPQHSQRAPLRYVTCHSILHGPLFSHLNRKKRRGCSRLCSQIFYDP